MSEVVFDAQSAVELAEVFQGLASPNRLRVLMRLRQAPSTVTALAEELEIGQASLSNHLRILRHAKLVTGDRDGRSVTYRLFDDHVIEFFDQALLHLGHAQPGGD
ncbi:helix-turn-helix transcriptional regulator [Leifsonia sp. NCR5]|uniref:ArsR/SmtB family transcription factor n=1 Tax=Leifsonia sp. NCR5 TaxID=1978342 RepID=UPI00211A6EE0|nr:metalloregulator ArsR/SmtB family transcription factor [Leifsonia sp. NCR5]